MWVQVDKLIPLAERTQPLPSHKEDITEDVFICSYSDLKKNNKSVDMSFYFC